MIYTNFVLENSKYKNCISKYKNELHAESKRWIKILFYKIQNTTILLNNVEMNKL